MSLEVLHISDCLEGGVPAVIDNLLYRSESRAVFLGHVPPGLKNREKCYAVSGYRRTLNPVKLLHVVWQIRKEIVQSNPRVLHLHSSYAGLLGACVAVLARTPVLYSPHASASLIPNPDLKTRLLRSLETVTINLANVVIACSRDEANVLMRKGCQRIVVIPNGVLTDEIDSSQVINDAGRTDFLYDVVGIGRDCMQKDLTEFSLIADFVKTIRPDTKFAWLGATAREGLSHNVHWLGYVDESSVDNILKRSKIFLATSIYEGLSIASIKAAAAGCTLLLRNTPGTRTLVANGAIGAIYNTPSQCASLAVQVLEHADILNRRQQQKKFTALRFSLKRQLKMSGLLYRIFN